jgi:hypothetical protein
VRKKLCESFEKSWSKTDIVRDRLRTVGVEANAGSTRTEICEAIWIEVLACKLTGHSQFHLRLRLRDVTEMKLRCDRDMYERPAQRLVVYAAVHNVHAALQNVNQKNLE